MTRAMGAGGLDTTRLFPVGGETAGVQQLDAPLTATAIAEELAFAEMRILVHKDEVVIGERPVPGEASVMRRIVARLVGEGRWQIAHLFSQPTYRHDLMHRRTVRDALELAVFVGGCCSVPYSRAEVAAIQAGAVMLGGPA